MKVTKDIMDIIKTYAGEDIDLCFYILQVLKEKDNSAAGLMDFFENIGLQKSNSSFILPKVIGNEELANMDSLYSKYINMFLKTLMEKAHLENWNKTKFYEYLWNSLNTDLILEDDRVRSFAMLRYAQSDLMPYIEVGKPLSMNDEEFSKILTENRSVVNKIKHIVALNYSQKTEVASLILNEVMSVKTEKERAVILAIALDIVTQSKLNGMTSMLNKIGIEIEQKK